MSPQYTHFLISVSLLFLSDRDCYIYFVVS
nr:MAG TPA: hypothetical protein [Caudoviricetes sp.]